MSSRVLAYPGCPTLSWMIASRVTNPHEESDAFISFTGRKGSSKSTSSIAFCEGLADDIAMLRNKGEEPTQFFNINHVKSITERGAVDILTSGILKQKNSIILLDDTGTQWGSRQFQSIINKTLNSIVQICRVYQCVLVANFIMAGMVDLQARQLQDYRAQMLYKDVSTGQAFFKFFYIEQGDHGEYKKYLTWRGMRIKTWIIEKPSEELYAEYKKMRHENTDQYIEDAQKKLEEKYNPAPKVDHRYTNYATHPVVIKNRDKVMALTDAGKKVERIVRETGLTRYWIQRIQALKKEEED